METEVDTDSLVDRKRKTGTIKDISLFHRILFLIPAVIVTGCGVSNVRTTQHDPVGAYELRYTVNTHSLSIRSIDVTPNRAGEFEPGKASLYQNGPTYVTGNTISAALYITNGSTDTWTGVELQAYDPRTSGLTANGTDVGNGWYKDKPTRGAWGWIFTSGTAGSVYTLPSGATSALKVVGINANSSFDANVYIYADVPIITAITPGSAGGTVTISGYNLGITSGSVTIGGLPATTQTWSDTSIVATIPTDVTCSCVTVATVDQNTPYSNSLISMITRSYTVGNNPYGIAIDASGNVWVANNGDGTVTSLDPSSGTATAYTVAKQPEGIAIDASGNVWVTNNGSDNVYELDSSGGSKGTYSVGSHPMGIAIDASGNAWVTNYESDIITEIVYPTGSTTKYKTGNHFKGIAVDASGNIWIANYNNNAITKLNASGGTIGTYPVGSNPFGMAIDASGDAWVTIQGGNAVTVLTPTGGTIGTYPVGASPCGIAIDASGNIWVANSGDNTVSELSADGTTVGTYSVGLTPMGIAIDQAGNVWVTDSGTDTVTELLGLSKGPEYWPYAGPVFPGGGNL